MTPEDERYDGESRGLSLFLDELRPLVLDQLGPSHLLHHAIERSLRSQDLTHLRHARQLFNSLPRETRQELSQGIVAQPGPEPAAGQIIERYAKNEASAFVSFSSTKDSPSKDPWQIEMAHELLDAPAMRVLIKPGTLPSTAAGALREIADRIEKDRRLLSERHWRSEHLKSVTEHSGVDVG